MKGYINLDVISMPGVDVVHDLNKYPWPFRTSQFNEINCSHILEHLNDFNQMIKELYRISKNKAIIRIYAPYFSGPIFWGEAGHKIHFSYRTFNYWSNQTPMFKTRKIKITFSMNSRILNRIFSPIINSMPRFYERFLCWILPSEIIEYELEVVKRKEGV